MKSNKLFLIIGIAILTSCFNPLKAQVIKGEVFAGGSISQVEGDECYRYRKPGAHVGAGALFSVTDWMEVGVEVLFDQRGAYKKDSINWHLGYYPHSYDLQLNYAEIPVMVYLTDKARYSFGLGVSYGRLVGLKEKVDGISTQIGIGDGKLHWKVEQPNLPDISQVSDFEELSDLIYSAGFSETTPIETLVPEIIANSNTYNPNDFTICADLRVRVWEGLHAEIRYQYSLRPIRTRMYYKDAAETIVMIDEATYIKPLQKQHNDSFTLRMVYIFGEDRAKVNKLMQQEERARNKQ